MTARVLDTDRKNILHNYSSYNYGLSLYMMKPELAGQTDIQLNNVNAENGFYLLAQSGGSKPEDRVPPLQLSTDKSGKRKLFEGLEFFIDDLSMTTAINAKSSGENSYPFSFDFRFVITEPIGTSFLSLLKASYDILTQQSEVNGVGSPENTFLNQPYALKISFSGYDAAGQLKKDFFQVLYMIKILKMKYRFDGKSPKYEVNAHSFNTFQATNDTSTVKKPITIKGVTFGDVLSDLKEKLTNREREVSEQLREVSESENTTGTPKQIDYIEYDFDLAGFDDLKNSRFVQTEDKTMKARKASMGSIDKTAQSTVKASSQPATIDREQYVESIAAGDNISKVLTNLIRKTEYFQQSLQVQIDQKVVGTSEENVTDTVKPESAQPKQKLTLFSVIPKVDIKSFDEVRKKYMYKATYQIKPYEIAYTSDPNVSETHDYVLFRRYDYFYTGQNLDVKSFEMTMDSSYQIIGVVASSTQTNTQGVPVEMNARAPNANSSGDISLTPAAQTGSNVLSDLSAPDAQIKAKLSIYGDPGYLIPDTFSMFGGNVDTERVDPSVRQTFITVTFKIAQDYEMMSGLLDVSDNLKLNLYSDDTGGGILYNIISVSSTFSGGQFSQDFDMVALPLADMKVITVQEQKTQT